MPCSTQRTQRLIRIVQARPLSKGEVLGCTAPSVEGRDALVYIGDGRCAMDFVVCRRKSRMASPTALRVRAVPLRLCLALRHRFHLEAIMIANPTATHYRSALPACGMTGPSSSA